ncbi:hypothetical protein QA640_24290 [Bradyrhizobium sp. CB82]|uniref:hypothetical protein n=1 Tax=Bradyrhizobium sp. CB82 TaxID=3039159 RepID=UPI0024B1989E|nr:hypothetical protein [Bradyrhizobium sp. CB82]WFU37590.1 hypothetical protein QA640_24290 [Bradyrhizobium sp. CB82]
MTTVKILHLNDGTYAVTVNGEVVFAGLLTSAAAWEEAEQLVESDTAEASDKFGDRFGGANGDRARHH